MAAAEATATAIPKHTASAFASIDSVRLERASPADLNAVLDRALSRERTFASELQVLHLPFIARTLIDHGHLEEAKAVLRIAQIEALKVSAKDHLYAFEQLAVAQARVGNLAAAYADATRNPDPDEQASTYCMIADVQADRGDFTGAQATLDAIKVSNLKYERTAETIGDLVGLLIGTLANVWIGILVWCVVRFRAFSSLIARRGRPHLPGRSR